MHIFAAPLLRAGRENMLWHRLPPKIYFKGGALELGLREMKGKKRAFIVTDKPLYEIGVCESVTRTLDSVGVAHTIFFDVEPDPTLSTVRKGLTQMELFKPDIIIAIGGGSPMDAAKVCACAAAATTRCWLTYRSNIVPCLRAQVMWLMYEVPETKFEGLSQVRVLLQRAVHGAPLCAKRAAAPRYMI
jgi:acetaldehyde dehydrogenase/alcohol dehydrogenase